MFGGFRGLRAYFATAKTGPVTAYVDGKPLGQIEIAPGATIKTTVAPVAAVSGLDADPAILGVCNESRCGVVRAR
jgi:hypothetical protein